LLRRRRFRSTRDDEIGQNIISVKAALNGETSLLNVRDKNEKRSDALGITLKALDRVIGVVVITICLAHKSTFSPNRFECCAYADNAASAISVR